MYVVVCGGKQQNGSRKHQSIVSLIGINLVSVRLLYTATCTNGYMTMLGSCKLEATGGTVGRAKVEINPS